MPAADILQRFRTNDLARFLNSHRIFFYTLVSLVSVSAVIINALKNYSNFYSVAIYLSKSSRSVLVLANFGVLLALLCGHIVQRIFFGSLRPNEVERLYDRLWFFITESLLAFTIFRDEFDTPFALMFGFLLFVKSFHWLASDRIEWMDQRPYPGPPLSFHFRMTVLFAILWATDCLMFLFAVEHTLTAGVGGMVLFASEYGILMASVMNTILKYLLSTYDLRRAGRRGGENAPPWENKSMWIFYFELATDFLKLTTYLIFFIIIITFYGLPLNILRDVYITARSFVTRLRALHRYQTATRNMDQRYPNATEAELTDMSDRTCIICREEMVSHGIEESPMQSEGPNTTPKKLPCGHIFHFHCLRSWLERQQSCPTCRRNVLEAVAAPAPATPGQIPHPPADAQQINPAAPRVAPLAQGANNNPLGFIGRLFGPPPGLANLAPNRQMPQNQGQVGVQAGGQADGLFINYQVQYQGLRPNDGNIGPAHQPQQLQPQALPPYPGFAGPGGVWQPWPAANDANHNNINLDATDPESIGPAARAEGASLDQTQSHPPSNGGTSATTSRTASEQSPVEQSDSRSARVAAADAALRRLGVKPSPGNSTNSPTSTPTVPPITNIDTSPTSTSTSSNTQQSAASNANQAPKLIPLLDFRPQPVSTSIPLSGAQPLVQNNIFDPMQFTRQGNRVLPQRFGQFNLQPQQSSRNPLPSRLPPTLTDEQLAALDTLTRDTIDERLRILEGVSSSVYRCIDDLMRMRSALPMSNAPPPASAGPNAANASVGEVPSVSQDQNVGSSRGKEKMKAVPVPEGELPFETSDD